MKLFLIFVLLIIFVYIIHGVLAVPKLDRNWVVDQKILAEINIDGDLVTIKNIRNISYRSTEDFDVSFYDKTFKLEELKAAWYAVEPFGQIGAVSGPMPLWTR